MNFKNTWHDEIFIISEACALLINQLINTCILLLYSSLTYSFFSGASPTTSVPHWIWTWLLHPHWQNSDPLGYSASKDVKGENKLLYKNNLMITDKNENMDNGYVWINNLYHGDNWRLKFIYNINCFFFNF